MKLFLCNLLHVGKINKRKTNLELICIISEESMTKAIPFLSKNLVQIAPPFLTQNIII
jgi:hypothetical protein